MTIENGDDVIGYESDSNLYEVASRKGMMEFEVKPGSYPDYSYSIELPDQTLWFISVQLEATSPGLDRMTHYAGRMVGPLKTAAAHFTYQDGILIRFSHYEIKPSNILSPDSS